MRKTATAAATADGPSTAKFIRTDTANNIWELLPIDLQASDLKRTYWEDRCNDGLLLLDRFCYSLLAVAGFAYCSSFYHLGYYSLYVVPLFSLLAVPLWLSLARTADYVRFRPVIVMGLRLARVPMVLLLQRKMAPHLPLLLSGAPCQKLAVIKILLLGTHAFQDAVLTMGLQVDMWQQVLVEIVTVGTVLPAGASNIAAVLASSPPHAAVVMQVHAALTHATTGACQLLSPAGVSFAAPLAPFPPVRAAHTLVVFVHIFLSVMSLYVCRTYVAATRRRFVERQRRAAGLAAGGAAPSVKAAAAAAGGAAAVPMTASQSVLMHSLWLCSLALLTWAIAVVIAASA